MGDTMHRDGKIGMKSCFEKKMRNLHSDRTFNVLAGYPGRNICSRQLRDRDYAKNETVKEAKIERGKIKRKNDLRVRMRGHNKYQTQGDDGTVLRIKMQIEQITSIYFSLRVFFIRLLGSLRK